MTFIPIPSFAFKQEPAWRELIARTLSVSIRTAASAIRDIPARAVSSSLSIDDPPATLSGQALQDIMSDAVAAVAIIAGSSGVLYPGAVVQSR